MMTPQEMRETLDVFASRPSPFSDFRRELQSTLLSVMRVVSYQTGEYLIRQGDPGEFLLVILEGTAAGHVRQAVGTPTPIAEFSAGAVVGEISLLTNEPRTADVIASTPVRALFLSAADFHRLAEAHPELRVVLTYVLADRLGRSSYDGLSGKDIHGYRILRCVGRGGMGIVYEGASLATGSTVALKMMNHALLYQPAAIKRFRGEAEALRSFQHPSIARLYDHFAAYQTEFLVMEFCEGVTLDHRIASHGPVPEAVVRKIVGQLAETLHYVHQLGQTHNDLKPSNVMIDRSGRAKLLDFGLARFGQSGAEGTVAEATTVSQPVGLVGTLRYMAPEQFSGAATDYRVDVYGLACVAYELLTGRPVVTASDLFGIIGAKHSFVLPEPHLIGPGITTDMRTFLAHGLETQPEKRTVDLRRVAQWAGPIEWPVD
jgi:eukaryotic-like serine/threonine-protein kinase